LKDLKYYFIAGFLLFLSCHKPNPGGTLFDPIPSNRSGIHFTNEIKNTTARNILDYLYYYNGGGVAAGDIDGDGLCDLFFVSNTGENHLYKNLGDFKFKDISDVAGISSRDGWKTGVCMADVNGDGLLDIYLCRVSGILDYKGHNELYINLGNDRFREESEQFGLGFKGFSTQAAFFDYDHDGDLDMVLINHAVHTQNSLGDTSLRHKKVQQSGLRLFKNDHGHFSDVTDAAGLYHSPISYSLGLAVADVDGDGWDDIYVGNDFIEDDYLFINHKNGTFLDERSKAIGHTSRFSMGNEIADINNDGLPDILTMDMMPQNEKILKSTAGDDPYDIYQYKRKAGYLDQFSRNCLQLNRGGGCFSEIGMLAGIEATDWSWAPLAADFNNDGFTDIFISSGIMRRPNDMDYIKYISGGMMGYALNSGRSRDLEAISVMPGGKAPNHLFTGMGDLRFSDASVKWGLDHPGLSNGAVYCDLNNDGKEDLVTNNLNSEAGIYRNTSPATLHHFLKVKLQGMGGNCFGTGAQLNVWAGGKLYYREMQPTRGFESSIEPLLHVGLGASPEVDSMRVVWADGSFQQFGKTRCDRMIVFDQRAAHGVFKYSTSAPDNGSLKSPLLRQLPAANQPLVFVHKENDFTDFNTQNLLPFALSCEGPHLAVHDDLLYSCNARNQRKFIYRLGAAGKYKLDEELKDAYGFEDTDAVFADFDGDGITDLLVASGGNESTPTGPLLGLRLYTGLKGGHFKEAVDPLPAIHEMVSCLRISPSKQGLLLFIGSRAQSGAYGGMGASSHLIKVDRGHWQDITQSQAPALKELGMVTDARFCDIDGDGQQDLVLAGDWMPITILINQKLHFIDATAYYNLSSSAGLWRSLACADIDGDGKMDIVAGNFSLNNRYRPNAAHPLTMYASDFGNTNQVKQVLASWKVGHYYPINSKDELTRQMPWLTRRFESYASFAGTPLDTVFTPDELAQARMYKASFLASTVFFQIKGQHSFTPVVLPPEAQFSPVFAILVKDLNGDKIPDLFLGGNFKQASMYNGRFDASTGEIMLGNGHRGFRSATVKEKGFILKGNVRDLKEIRIGTSSYILAARNNDSLLVFVH